MTEWLKIFFAGFVSLAVFLTPAGIMWEMWRIANPQTEMGRIFLMCVFFFGGAGFLFFSFVIALRVFIAILDT